MIKKRTYFEIKPIYSTQDQFVYVIYGIMEDQSFLDKLFKRKKLSKVRRIRLGVRSSLWAAEYFCEKYIEFTTKKPIVLHIKEK